MRTTNAEKRLGFSFSLRWFLSARHFLSQFIGVLFCVYCMRVICCKLGCRTHLKWMFGTTKKKWSESAVLHTLISPLSMLHFGTTNSKFIHSERKKKKTTGWRRKTFVLSIKFHNIMDSKKKPILNFSVATNHKF